MVELPNQKQQNRVADLMDHHVFQISVEFKSGMGLSDLHVVQRLLDMLEPLGGNSIGYLAA